MFIDENIIQIVKRAGGMTNPDVLELIQMYLGYILDTIAFASMDYYMQKENLQLNTTQDIVKFLDNLPEKYLGNPELVKQVQDELADFDDQLLDEFKKWANLGDILYLQVYLKSNIRKMKKELQDTKTTRYSIQDVAEGKVAVKKNSR